MVKQGSVVKLNNLVVPCARKESKDSRGYLKSYRVVPAYSREGMYALFDAGNKKSRLALGNFKVVLKDKGCSSRDSRIGPDWQVGI